MIDLHLHTTFSDGNSEPQSIIRQALQFGLEAIAITDHDNVYSFPMAKAAAEGTGLDVIPGIEVNTVWKEYDTEVHVLGYYIDRENPGLQRLIDRHRTARVTQMKKISELLRDKGKIDISFDDIAARSREEGSLGRPHVARTLLDKGSVHTISEAFNKYLNTKSPTYLRRETASPHEAVEAIYECGGIPVIAHPGDMKQIEQLVVELMDYGLRGLEAYHKSHSPAVIEYHCSLAEKYGLIVTGGTDYHGDGDEEGYIQALGRFKMPDYVYAELKKEHERRQMAAFKVS